MIENEDLHEVLHQIKQELSNGRQRFIRLEKQIGKVAAAQTTMQNDISDTKDIVEAWSTVRSMAKFIKWFSGIVVALAAIYVAIKAGVGKLL